MSNPIDKMYKILIKQNGVSGKVNGVECKFLLTECQDSNTNGTDLMTISTDKPLEQGYFVNIGTDTYLVIDKKHETIAYQSYNIGTIQKTNHLNKFVSNEVIYQIPSICTNITKGKLGMIYESAGITEANGVWCFITQLNDISKKIKTGTRFIINGEAWGCTSLDFTTDQGILYVILRKGAINVETDDMINEVADGLSLPTYAITLNSTSQNLYGTYTFQILPTCTRNNVADTSAVVTYTSSDSSIATVTNSGFVTAQSKLGSATISAEYKGKIVTMTINVVADVYSIDLSSNSASIFVDETYQINSVCKKNNVVVSSPQLTYVSNDTSIATIDDNGMISAIGQGSCNIICGYANVTATFNLTSNANVYTIDLSETSKSIIQDGTYQIEATCKKNSAIVSNPVITYSSSNTNIASVSATGEVTTLAVGNVDITCSYQGVNTVISIIVEAKPIVHTYTINLEPTDSVYQGSTYQVNAICKDNDVTVENPIVSYLSDNTSIATIDATGLVTTVNIGTCNITATFEGVSDTLSFEVKKIPHTYTIALDSSSQSLFTGNTHQIIATCTDNGSAVSSPVVSFVSSDTSIATVSSTGLVTTIASGTATITATYENVSATLSLTVTVEPVAVYTENWSQTTTIKQYVTSTYTVYYSTDNGVTKTYPAIDYVLDSAGVALGTKITVTRKSDNSFSVKNNTITTLTTCHVSITERATGKLLSNTLLTFKSGI
ncbi:hypothetical protein CBE01nite_29620 [Clostridium beijerinckii]|uniref:Ig-like domain-containing protein n=1 Tax=Clostridium beijerinckii TaxID=1520 RepID=A0AB74VD12_CLOBE|nr:Ig-like domain-containing protein [Clostridium beijerinckii]NRZ28742.1 uncharacterized protein YjdB [Clostridium beijerinckii]NYB95482.1 uncharacterized protein YjdB [Clostridium beijerinckii]OOM24597.1 bacterial Ig-like domain protein [Clostridium beijerinckii]QUN34420.1 Ig-like domain-containing protein [Clostridium beijerinckii]SQB00626.1 Ig domain-containing protein [Clostridium beijerinckii]